MKMQEIIIKIQGIDGQPRFEPVRAVIVGALAVHRVTQYNRITRKFETPNTWCITHISSGLCVCSALKRRQDALALAEAMGAVIDWSKDADALKRETSREEKDALLMLAKQYDGVVM